MMTSFSQSGTAQLDFTLLDEKLYAETRIRGAKIWRSDLEDGCIIYQEMVARNFVLSLYELNFSASASLNIQTKRRYTRMLVVLSGEHKQGGGREGRSILLTAGQYQLTNDQAYLLSFPANTRSSIFQVCYNEEFLDNIGLDPVVTNGVVQVVSAEMCDIIDRILDNDYTPAVRDFFYDNCIRELLFYHWSRNKEANSSFAPEVMAAVFRADSIIRSDLADHYTIPQIARMTGINSSTLKKAYRSFFQMGLFERLSAKRMEKAKDLLVTTELPVNSIAVEAGYQHVSSFVKAFRKKFSVSPLEWRTINRR